MQIPLLTTKLNIPLLRPDRVSRHRLTTRLNKNLWGGDGFLRKLSYISAPAGYGKTTLVLEWLDQLPEWVSGSKLVRPVAWLSLDENDNDPARFLAYIIAAIQGIQPGCGDATRAIMQSPQLPPWEILLTTLLNEMAAIPDPYILVLDDYHCIQTPEIHQQVGFLLEHQPNRMHVVLTTREDPLLPLSRLRAGGQMAEIRQEELRFSSQECAEFLKDVMGIPLSEAEIEALDRRTEGWIAGLQLAAFSMQGYDDPAGFIKSFTGSSRFVLDYLVEEVYKRQPVAIQDFLLKTSILDRLSGPLCDFLTEGSNGQVTLGTLEGANLFIIPLDQSRTWFRYHRLFSEILRHRLRTDNHITESGLHKRASLWFQLHGFMDEAIHHAIAAGNWERTSELLMSFNAEMLKRGETITLVRWFSKFPPDIIQANPELSLAYCWPLILTGQLETAAPLLDQLEQAAKEIPTLLGEVLVAQSHLALSQGDHARMVERSQRALKNLPKESVNSRGIAALNLVLAYWHMGQMEATEQVVGEAIEAARATGNQYSLITAIIFKGRVFAVRGQLHQAREVFQQAIEQGGKIPINALAHLDMSALHYEWNNFPESENHLQAAIELSKRGQNNEFLAASYMFLTHLRLAQGDPDGARRVLSRIQDMMHAGEIPPATYQRAVATQVQFSLAQGDLETALELADQLNDQVDCHPFYRFTGLSKARLLIAQKEIQAARNYLNQLYEKALGRGWVYAQIVIRIWQTLTADTKEEAVRYLGEALQTAQSGGFIWTFVEQGEALRPILQECAHLGITPEYIGKILTTIQQVDNLQPNQAGLVEMLSDRELEVLRLLVAGLSNREIAQQLVISLGTAKTHIHNIYGKLDASNRAQAIARAREYRLV